MQENAFKNVVYENVGHFDELKCLLYQITLLPP